jgi:hypothetical protein
MLTVETAESVPLVETTLSMSPLETAVNSYDSPDLLAAGLDLAASHRPPAASRKTLSAMRNHFFIGKNVTSLKKMEVERMLNAG